MQTKESKNNKQLAKKERECTHNALYQEHVIHVEYVNKQEQKQIITNKHTYAKTNRS